MHVVHHIFLDAMLAFIGTPRVAALIDDCRSLAQVLVRHLRDGGENYPA